MTAICENAALTVRVFLTNVTDLINFDGYTLFLQHVVKKSVLAIKVQFYVYYELKTLLTSNIYIT
jgi:hypothetical protein